MNWSKIKTIMIFLLVAMNIFIAAFILFTTFKESSVPQEVISSTKGVLEKNGFTVNINTIPNTSYNLPVLNASFYSASDLSDMFFGKQLAFSTVKNSLVAIDNGAKLTVMGNHFIFETQNSADKSHSYKKIKKALEKSGIDMEGAVYDEKELCFYKMYKGTNLFNIYIIAELDKEGQLCYVSSLWPGKLTEYDTKTLSFTTSVTKLPQLFPEGGTIDIIEAGYALKPLGSNKYRFTPAWRVRVGNNIEIIE